MAGANGKDGEAANPSQGLLGLLVSLLVAEKSGFQLAEQPGMATLREFADRMTREAMESMQKVTAATPPAPGTEPTAGGPAVLLETQAMPTAKTPPTNPQP